MEAWDTIRARRNVRQYTDQPITRTDLERILDAGRRAPSASNWQPWNFVVVTNRPQLVELAKVWQGARNVARSAATIAFVVRQPEDSRHHDLLMYDLGQATANIILAAADLVIGSGHASVSNQQQARRVLTFPDGYFCAYRSVWAIQPTVGYARSSGRTGAPSTKSSIGISGRRVHGLGRAWSNEDPVTADTAKSHLSAGLGAYLER
jgi:nitroreductase